MKRGKIIITPKAKDLADEIDKTGTKGKVIIKKKFVSPSGKYPVA